MNVIEKLLTDLMGVRPQGEGEATEGYVEALDQERAKRDTWDASYLSARYPARVLARATASRFRDEGIAPSMVKPLTEIGARADQEIRESIANALVMLGDGTRGSLALAERGRMLAERIGAKDLETAEVAELCAMVREMAEFLFPTPPSPG